MHIYISYSFISCKPKCARDGNSGASTHCDTIQESHLKEVQSISSYLKKFILSHNNCIIWEAIVQSKICNQSKRGKKKEGHETMLQILSNGT